MSHWRLSPPVGPAWTRSLRFARILILRSGKHIGRMADLCAGRAAAAYVVLLVTPSCQTSH